MRAKVNMKMNMRMKKRANLRMKWIKIMIMKTKMITIFRKKVGKLLHCL